MARAQARLSLLFWGKAILAGCLLAGTPALAQSNVRAGFGRVVGSNILHPVGQVYDQVLMTGPTVTVAADTGQVVRVSFLDQNDDITQVEFAGTGTVTVELDGATYRGPAQAVKYNQPEVSYVQGRASVRVSGAGADTFISIFSVGRGNAINQALFPAGMTYDARADIQLLQIEGADLGAVLTGNVRYSGETGATGIQAPHTVVHYRVVVGEIDARAEATPLLRLGAASPLTWDGGEILVAGGRLQQSNGLPIDVSSSAGTPFLRIRAVAGALSSGDALPAGVIAGQFASKSPGTIVVNGQTRAARGYVPASFDDLLTEGGFDAFNFGSDVDVWFSGGNSGTYYYTMDTIIEGEKVHARLDGGYSYLVEGANQNRVTLSMTFTQLDLTSASVSYRGTIAELARQSGTALPVRITAVAEFESAVSGQASVTILYSSGQQESYSTFFDLDHELDLEFF